MIALPTVAPARKPDTRDLLPLDQYDLIFVSYSGGKDSTANLCDLRDRGVDPKRIVLAHQCVDGEAGVDDPLVDWPCTEEYVRAVGKALGIRVLFQWRMGGFRAEMLKQDERSRPVRFECLDGTIRQAGGIKGKISTRRKFPQPCANLATRWCSAILKIDAFDLFLNNDPDLKRGKFLFLSGERREEGKNGGGRALYAEREPHRCDGVKRRVDTWRSVIDWSEEQVWDAMKRHRIKPHPAYLLGFPRVSCLTCIFGGPDQWASVRKVAPERFEAIARYERDFGFTIKQGESVVSLADRGTPYPECDVPGLVAAAMSRYYPAEGILLPPGVWTLPPGAYKRGGGPI